MNKAELIYRVCEESGLSKTEATAAVEAMLGNVERALARGDMENNRFGVNPEIFRPENLRYSVRDAT